MAVLKIARLGNPILRRVAQPVDLEQLNGDPENELQKFIDDLIDTMHHEGGVGIAAPQVGRSQQIVIAEYVGNERYPDQENIPLSVLINPVITRYGTGTLSFWEGCLSLNDLRGLVTRPDAVTVEAFDRTGQPVTIEASGFFAVVLQHEIDHLLGKVFIDRMTDFSRLAYYEEFQEYWLEEASQPAEI